jgi:uncharacterized protein (DUF1330 family)
MTSAATIFPTQSQLEELQSLPAEEPVVMLNLLRFKDRADGIDEGVSGREAYGRYADATGQFLEKVGGRLLNAVDARQVVIGPAATEWDMALLVEYPSPRRFLEMAGDPEYLKAHAHRDAALADSRLIACSPVTAVRF